MSRQLMISQEPFMYREFEAPDPELEGVWEGETNRSSPGYVRWVQESLNKILGLRLAADGKMGPATRSAIRSFQQRQGLAADGILGPRTEATLKRALAQGPGQPSPQTPGQCQVLDRFAFDRDQLTPAHQSAIASIAQAVVASQATNQPVRTVRLIGHTDPVGPAAYNLALAQRRASQVGRQLRAALQSRRPGILATIAITEESRGEAEPVSPDPAMNRRVQVCLGRAVAPRPPKKNPPPRRKNVEQEIRRWFTTGGRPAMQPIRPGNDVLPLIGGAQAFGEMLRAIWTATGPGHFIYLAGWYLDDSFPLVGCDPNTAIGRLFARASQSGVQVRAMLWDQVGTQNSAQVKRINRLARGAAILDNRTLWFGSHHQKILIVKGSQGLIAFCGGVDINSDRIPPCPSASSSGGSGSGSGSGSGGGGGGSPLHDVHCRIRGPAARSLLLTFVQRWLDHPAHVSLDRSKGELLGAAELRLPLPSPSGPAYVQIGRTYGNGSRHHGIGRGGYRFAPDGERTVRRMVLQAISQARRFIYMEDQYLVSLEVRDALLAALPHIQHLTILIPHSRLLSSSECPQDFHAKRREFIAPLRRAGGSKVRVFVLNPPGAPNTYVHAKTWIFDDEYAIIGSANCNRRGYTHDSEVAAGIYDPSDASLVKQLRIGLWAKHLNLDNPAGRARLADGLASAALWLSPPPGARIAPFNENAPISTSNAPRCRVASWNGQIDPDGS